MKYVTKEQLILLNDFSKQGPEEYNALANYTIEIGEAVINGYSKGYRKAFRRRCIGAACVAGVICGVISINKDRIKDKIDNINQ